MISFVVTVAEHQRARHEQVDGSCLCGGVSYSSNAEPVLTGICHCRHCQKLTGSSFSVSIAVPRSSLTIEGDSLRTFDDTGDSGLPVQRQFCGTCGSQIVSSSDAIPDLAFIKAGTLDDVSWLNPTVEIWCEDAQPWVEFDESRHRASRNPPPS